MDQDWASRLRVQLDPREPTEGVVVIARHAPQRILHRAQSTLLDRERQGPTGTVDKSRRSPLLITAHAQPARPVAAHLEQAPVLVIDPLLAADSGQRVAERSRLETPTAIGDRAPDAALSIDRPEALQVSAFDALPDLYDAAGNVIPRMDSSGDFDERYLRLLKAPTTSSAGSASGGVML